MIHLLQGIRSTPPKQSDVRRIRAKDFVTQVPPAFSAGLSLDAGLLLAAALLRRSAVFSGPTPHRQDMTTLNFLNDGLADANLRADDARERN